VKKASLTTTDGRIVCARCLIADGAFGRMRGLLGRKELPSGEGILLRPSGSVHTFFMRFPIDVVFLDRELRVVAIAANVPPWRMRGARGAKAVLELTAGEASRRALAEGQTLLLSEPPK
jgi:uncharacterized membrane protein (UPF0127 family)